MSRDFHYIRLGVNIDHVATVRQARGGDVPDPVAAALLAERGGADGITVHLREDRRHIQERDVELLRRKIGTKLNLEIALNSEIMEIALRARPDDVCLVPERREELTTEGGLDVARQKARVKEAVARFQGNGIRVSLFVDPEALQVEASGEIGAHGIELHTGRYCNATESRGRELEHLIAAASQARGLGLEVHAGHGLSLENVAPVAGIPEIVEINVGHSIIARAIMVGIEHAVREMKELLTEARASVSIIPR